jgi:hypothetical protein
MKVAELSMRHTTLAIRLGAHLHPPVGPFIAIRVGGRTLYWEVFPEILRERT